MPTARHAAPTAGVSPPWPSAVCLSRAPPPPRTGWHTAPWLSECAEGSEEAPRGWGELGSRVTSPVVLPEELLAVVGRVRLLHLRDPVPGPLPLEGWGEEGRPVVPLGGGGCAEGGHLGTRSVSPGWPGAHPSPACRARPAWGLSGRWPPAPPREEPCCPPGASAAGQGSLGHRASLAADTGRAPSRRRIHRTVPITLDVRAGWGGTATLAGPGSRSGRWPC